MSDETTTATEPAAMTKDEIRTIVSGIVRESLKTSLPKAIQEAVKGAIETEIAPLRERIESKPKDGSDGDGDHAKAAVQSNAQAPAVVKPDPEIDKLRKEIAKLTANQADAQKRAADSERRRVEAEGIASLRSSLTGKVAAGAEDAVLAILRGRNAVAFGDDGAVRLKLRASADEPEDGLDLDGGIAAFLKTPEAKFFVPAPNGGAGGTKRLGQATPPNSAPRNGANGQPADVASAFEAKFGARLDDAL